MIRPPRAPLGVRALNGLLGLVPAKPLNSATLIDDARRKAGLRDFGPDGPFEDALSGLGASLDQEASLAPLGLALIHI